MAKVIAFDLDGVCTNETHTAHEDLAGTYVYRSANLKARDLMREAYNSGWTVVVYTGRKEAHRRITEDWLYAHGFHYHFLIMGKAYYSWIIDDRSISLEKFKAIVAPRLSEDIQEDKRIEATHRCSPLQAFTDDFLKDIATAIHRGSRLSFDTLGIKLEESVFFPLTKLNVEQIHEYMMKVFLDWIKDEVKRRLPPTGPMVSSEENGREEWRTDKTVEASKGKQA